MKNTRKDIRRRKKWKAISKMVDQISDQMTFSLGLGGWKRHYDTCNYDTCNVDFSYFRAEVDFFTAKGFHILRLDFSTIDQGEHWCSGGQTHVVQLSKIQEILNVVVMAINT